MKSHWIDIGPLDELEPGKPTLRKGEGRRFVCVRDGDAVHALDDRCPHQGYPLSQGTVRGSVLTCEWHNWKFELGSGACSFGGEAVRHYPSRVEDGRVHLDIAIDLAAETRRLVAGLRAALLEDESSRALREGLRLGELGIGPIPAKLGTLDAAFEVLARDGAERAEHGFDHGLAVLADLCAWAERGWIPAEEAFLVGSHAVAEPSVRLGRRSLARQPSGPRAMLVRIADLEAGSPAHVSECLEVERREDAEARIRSLVGERGPESALPALLPFLTKHIYDYGHGAIFFSKALELSRRFQPAAIELLAASTVQLAWATADTKLPPFKATRAGLARLAEIDLTAAPAAHVAWDRAAFETAVLAGETSACDAVLARLTEGCEPRELLRGVAHAAARRLARFDPAWQDRLDAEVGPLDVTHAVTFADAAITLSAHGTRAQAAAFALLSAAFVGKLRKADTTTPIAAAPGDGGGDLVAAVTARDLPRALACAAALDARGRIEAYARLAPFAAFDAAVRPILYAHTVKNTEAMWRLEREDPQADGVYLEALLRFIVPLRKETSTRRAAAVAKKFLVDGRPPEGLY
jgi:nitrite reductase/ring-hydroxylating ferredoxin subunit/CBS domain-containing protein